MRLHVLTTPHQRFSVFACEYTRMLTFKLQCGGGDIKNGLKD